MTFTRGQLPEAIRGANQHANLAVPNDTVRELGERAAERMGRSDLTFTVEAVLAKAESVQTEAKP